MNSQECESTAKEASTLSDGLLLGRCSSVRQGGPGCSNVAASGVNGLLSTVSRVSDPHRESMSEIVRLFAAQPERGHNGRVCSVCNRIWLCRAEHRHCVHSVSDQSRVSDPRERLRQTELVEGSEFVGGLRRSWRLREEACKATELVKKEIEYTCGSCGENFGEHWERFWVHVESECQVFSFKGEIWKDDVSISKLKVVPKIEENTCTRERWSSKEDRKLWEVHERCLLDGDGNLWQRVWEEWTALGMRRVKVQTLAARVRKIKMGELSGLERDDIRRMVRRQCLPVVVESVDENPCVECVDPVVEEHLDDPVVEEADDQEHVHERVHVDRVCDVFVDGDAVTPVTEEQGAVVARLREVMLMKKFIEVPSLKSRDRLEVKAQVKLVNGVIGNLVGECQSISDSNRLLHAASVVVAERLGLLKDRKGSRQKKKDPWWKRRIERSIVQWRKDLSKIEELRRGRWKPSESERKRMDKLYDLTEKGAKDVGAFLKSKVHSGSVKLQRYLKKSVQFHQNTLFKNNQSALYKELNGVSQDRNNPAPDAQEANAFWSGIWSQAGRHEADAEWLGKVRQKLSRVGKQGDLVVDVTMVRAGIRRLSNWKAPGPDGVTGFWFKKITALHPVIAIGLDDCLQSGNVPDWMVKGRTVLIQKDSAKGTVASNYRPIACLPLMWKLLTGIFAEQIYGHLKDNDLLPDEQKGCRKRTRGTKDQLLIDKAIMLDAKRKRRFLGMAWVDYKKAYDMVPHSWLLEVVEMMGVADNVRSLLEASMSNWKTELSADGKSLGVVDIKRGIFQGDSLSPLLFVMVMAPLSMILKGESKGYKLGNTGKLVNHLLFMDDLKLYASSQRELDSLVRTVESYSRDIGMEFGMDKCAVLVVKDGKQVRSEGVELPSGEVMKDVDENGYKYLGVLQAENVKNREMKDKVRTEYLRRVKLLSKSELYAGNLVKGINAWAIGVVRYSAGIVDWTKEDLKQMDVKTRKILTLCGAFHKRGSVFRLYLKRKEGGRGLISVEDCVRQEEAGLSTYVKGSGEWMLKAVADMGVVSGEETAQQYKDRMERTRRETLRGKPLHGKFFRKISGIADERTWQWLNGGYLTKATEGYVMAAQEQALRTRWVKAMIDGEADVDPMCRLCGVRWETVTHLVSGCGELAKKQYTRRHDSMGKRVHWELCKKHGIKCASKWYDHVPSSVSTSENGDVEIYWDRTVITVNGVDHNRPDVVVIEKSERRWTLIDFSVPMDQNVDSKEIEKEGNYSDLAREIRRDYKVHTEIVPVVIGALGTVPKKLAGNLKKLGVPDVIGCLQTTALLGTVRILKNVLSI